MACEHRWTGLSASHCAACHETFTGLSPFDRHQRLQDGRTVCLAPESATDAKGRQIFTRTAGRGYWSLARYDGREAPQWHA